MRKPNLFIVGHPKSGTTALHHFLEQHPDVYMSTPKEPKYFCKDLHQESDIFHKSKKLTTIFPFRQEKDYLKLFSNVKKEKLIGESSAIYLFSIVAAKEIHSFNPDAKIIIMLRNPVDFIYSFHSEHILRNTENVKDFKAAIFLEKQRRQGKNLPSRVTHPSILYYSEWTKYSEQVGRYFDLFDRSNIKVIIFEDFKKNNKAVYENVLRFLGLNSSFVPNFKMINVSKKPRNNALNILFHNYFLITTLRTIFPPNFWFLLRQTGEKILFKKEQRLSMDSCLREMLMEKYKPEVFKIGKLLNTDLERLWCTNQ